ncbi:hypothetical protein LXL04_015378 [Taraxacum kok-saghyz]
MVPPPNSVHKGSLSVVMCDACEVISVFFFKALHLMSEMMDYVSLSRLRARSEKPTNLVFHIHLYSCYLIRTITVNFIKEMVRSIWCLHEKSSKNPDYDAEYGRTDTYFTLQLAYGGFFTKPPGRKCVDGLVSNFDYVDVDLFSFEEQPPQFHFEMPNIDDAFHYDDYSLYATFDAEYNNTDVLAGVGVEDSSVESGWRTARDGNNTVMVIVVWVIHVREQYHKKGGRERGRLFEVNLQRARQCIFIFHTSISNLFIALSKHGITTMALGHIGGSTHPMNPQFVPDLEHLQNCLPGFLAVQDASLIAGPANDHFFCLRSSMKPSGEETWERRKG